MVTRILVLGDIHGAFRGRLNPLINERQPDVILSVGDFGFWPNYPGDPSDLEKDIKNQLRNGKRCEIHFCDGNHEDHAALRNLAGSSKKPVEVGPSIFYQPRGSACLLPNGQTVLFVGGAKSVDWQDREEDIDWFREEILTQEDLPNPLPAADVVISHTAPNLFPLQRDDRFDPRWDRSPDFSRDVLDQVFHQVRPDWWYFGHFHKYRYGEFEGCRWLAMGAAQTGGRWWIELEKWGGR